MPKYLPPYFYHNMRHLPEYYQIITCENQRHTNEYKKLVELLIRAVRLLSETFYGTGDVNVW
jgi:hypothetical protein